MEFFISTLLFGISVGGQYALIAIGYTMVYGILRLINFAHGDVFMVAGLLGIYLNTFLAAYLPPSLVIPAMLLLVLVLTVALGFCIERVAYKPLRTAPRMSVMISAIGVSYLLQNSATYITGGQPMIYPSIPLLSNTITVAGTCSSTIPRSAWLCGRWPRILRRASSWASRSTPSSPPPLSSVPPWQR